MKFLLLASLCILSTAPSFANDEKEHKKMEKKMDKMSFEDAKKMKLEMLDEKASMVEKEKACVTAATDKTGLKDCMKEMMKKHKEMKDEMKDKMDKKAE
jgi:hypothetical protein